MARRVWLLVLALSFTLAACSDKKNSDREPPKDKIADKMTNKDLQQPPKIPPPPK